MGDFLAMTRDDDGFASLYAGEKLRQVSFGFVRTYFYHETSPISD